MNLPISKFVIRKDPILHEGRLGLLCNHVAYDFDSGAYLHEILAERGVLRRVFVPEHGLFAELQDQEALPDAGIYHSEGGKLEYVSLYGDTEDSLKARPEQLEDLDALVIALQDVGSRYYTFAVTMSDIIEQIAESGIDLKVYVIDYPNPAGRYIEGTVLPTEYASFVGRPGMLHRHGMTIGELCRYYRAQSRANFELEVISLDNTTLQRMDSGAAEMPIPPSPNIPFVTTTQVYAGQCLLEGTNLSEGRGTTRPFEIFGAPYLNVQIAGHKIPIRSEGAVLRPLRFRPTFHKFVDRVCEGYQIHLTGRPYHSLAFSLQLLRYLSETHGKQFEYLPGVYEFRSDRPAIELLAGDPLMLEYLRGQGQFAAVRQAMVESEQGWIKQMSEYLLYDIPFRRTELLASDDYA